MTRLDLAALRILPRHLAMVLDMLRQYLPDAEVWAYGSRVTGTGHEASDLDLVVRNPENPQMELPGVAELKEAFMESDLPIRVDVVEWARVPESFHRNIEARYVVMQEGNGKAASFRKGIEGERVVVQSSYKQDRRISTWGEEISLEYGKALRGYADAKGPVQVFGTNGPVGWTDTPLAPGPGVILGRKGAYRGVHFSKRPFFVIDTAYYVAPKTDLDMRWLYYSIIHEKLGEIDDGSPIPSTTRAAVYVRDVEIPSPVDQRAIAAVLGALDDRIELNRRMNETLEAMARVLFKDWFVDFGPTRAKAEGRPAYLAPEIWDLFPDALDNEDKPVGWQFGNLMDLADLHPESWSKKNPPQSVEYVDLANTKWGTIESTQFFEWAKAPSRAQQVLRPGDTIVGTVRPGNGSYSLVGRDGLTGSTRFAVLRPKTSACQELVYLTATSKDNIERLTHLADGAAYPAVRPNVVGETEFPLPGEKAIEAFSAATHQMIDRVEANKLESQTLAQLRDLLLPKLMTGEIRVRDAEKAVENLL